MFYQRDRKMEDTEMRANGISVGGGAFIVGFILIGIGNFALETSIAGQGYPLLAWLSILGGAVLFVGGFVMLIGTFRKIRGTPHEKTDTPPSPDSPRTR
jgi:uncharacterized membrane protein YphA (DoxX/SURF4 family)